MQLKPSGCSTTPRLWCEEQLWGRKLAAVRVVLADCDPAVVAELVEDAWRHHS